MDHMEFSRLALDFCVGTIYGTGYKLLFPMGVQVRYTVILTSINKGII